MIRTLFRSALVALLVATGFAVAQPHVPAGAATFTVTDTADDVLTPNTLRWAIEQANNDAGAPVIEIASGLAIDLTCAGGGTLVYDNTTDQPLTIEGNGATITQTCAASAVLSTASEDVTVRTTTITGGTSSGILSNGDVLIEDSVVEGNSGGGVTAYTGTATIVRSTLADNSGGAGGGVGAIHVVVEDSTLAGNDASTGGGAWADQTATVVNSTVSGNTATVSGGGVYAGLNEIDLTYSTIVGNTSPLAANVQLDFSAMITSFATIIGEPQGGGADIAGALGCPGNRCVDLIGRVGLVVRFDFGKDERDQQIVLDIHRRAGIQIDLIVDRLVLRPGRDEPASRYQSQSCRSQSFH
jgi:hypothetical protein